MENMRKLMVSSFYIDSIQGAWKLLISIGAGTGLVYMLRWYWWRINAYSEISAMIAALIGYLISNYFNLNESYTIIFTTIFTSFVWISITLLTPPEPKEKLINFYNKVKPRGNGWKKVTGETNNSVIPQINNALLGIAVVYAFLFGLGKMLLQQFNLGGGLLVCGILIFLLLVKRININE